MTVAAIGALVLKNALAHQKNDDLTGLARRFQRQLAKANQTPWQLSAGADILILPPEEQNQNRVEKMIGNYIQKLTALLPSSLPLSMIFSEVTQLLKPPTVLFRPAIIWKVLTGKKPA